MTYLELAVVAFVGGSSYTFIVAIFAIWIYKNEVMHGHRTGG